MKNIGLFNSVKSWGGGEKWYYDMACNLSKKGYNVHFFLIKNTELHKLLKDVTNIKFHYVKSTKFSFLNPIKLYKLYKVLSKLHLDVLIINLYNDLKFAGYLANKIKIRKIIFRQGVPLPIKETALNKYIFSHCLSDIVANSEATKKALLSNNSDFFPSDRIKVIYNPIDTREFLSREYTKVYNKKDDEIVISSIGRLEVEKNHKFLIDLSLNLNKNSIKHKIIIAGIGSRLELLSERIKENKLEENFIFTGFVENVKNVLLSSDIFFLPSLYEGFGYAIVEASLCKLPVIAFDTTCIPEIIIDGKTGFVIELNSTEEATEKIKLLCENEELRLQLSENAQQFAINNFSEGIILQNWIDFLE